MGRGARLKDPETCWLDSGFSMSRDEVIDAEGPHRDRIARLVRDGIMEYCKFPSEDSPESDQSPECADPPGETDGPMGIQAPPESGEKAATSGPSKKRAGKK